MSFKDNHFTPSLSHSSEDWDRSESEIVPSNINAPSSVSRNSVVFPGDGSSDSDMARRNHSRGKEGRSLSELMKLHAEKGTDVTFGAEEASRVADVLKQWINSGMSPYEGEDDFFSHSQDDLLLRSLWTSRPLKETNTRRPRGQSESLAFQTPSPGAT